MISRIPALSQTVGLKPRFGLGLDIQPENKARVYVSGHDDMDSVELRYNTPGEALQTLTLEKNPALAQWELPKGTALPMNRNLDIQVVGKKGTTVTPIPLNTMMKRVLPTGLLPAPKAGEEDGFLLHAINKDGGWKFAFPLTWNGRQWEVINNFVPELTYSIMREKNGKRTVYKTSEEVHAAWGSELERRNLLVNQIPAYMKRPGGQGTSLLAVHASLLNAGQLASVQHGEAQGDWSQFATTHFPPTHNHLQGHDDNELLHRLMREVGVSVFEPRPLIGGDGRPVTETTFETVTPMGKKPSGHGYWGSNIYQLNGSVSTPAAFEQMAMSTLNSGAPMRFDGAFVNEGVNGIHYLSNMLYGSQSPTLNWFDFGKGFPHEPLKLGVLPAKTLTDGQEVPQDDKWNLRLVPNYNPKNPESKPYFQLYNPLLEDAHGKPLKLSPEERLARWPKSSQDSVQDYMIPVDASMVDDLKHAITLPAQKRGPAIRALLDKGFQSGKSYVTLTTSAYDNSGKKWDGQRDVNMLQLQNPDVQKYLKDGCRFWTDKVDRIYTRQAANALEDMVRRFNGDWTKAHLAINKTSADDLTARHVLPMLKPEDAGKVTEASIKQAIADYKKQGKAQTLPAHEFLAKQIVSDFPVGSLPATLHMQIHLSNPRLTELLKDGDKPAWFVFVQNVFGPIAKGLDKVASVFKKGATPFQSALNWLRPKSFQQRLAQRLESVITTLPKETQEKLKDPILGHLYYEEMARSVYLTLLTGKFVSPAKANGKDPYEMARLMANHVPSVIPNAHPDLSARLLTDFLVQGLKDDKTMDWKEFGKNVDDWLRPLDGESAAVTRHILNQRRLGLHWRIDAFKDLADMARVRDVHPDHRTPILKEEIGRAKDVMATIQEGVREVFPNSEYIMEVTDFDLLTKDTELKDDFSNPYVLKRFLYEGNVANGKVGYRHMYSGLPGALGGCNNRKDEPGGGPVSSVNFIREKLREMMEVAPLDRAMNYQNITSNHDKSTTIHMLAVHPLVRRYDYFDWFGLNNKLKDQTVNEIVYKTPFVAKGLSFAQVEKLATAFESAAAPDKTPFSDAVKPYLEGRPTPLIPIEIKAQYIKEAMATLRKSPPSGISTDQLDAFELAMTELITEPSELKAYRGLLHNTMLNLMEAPQGSAYETLGKDVLGKLTDKQKQALKAQFGQMVWEDTHSVGPENYKWMAKRPLDETFHRLVSGMPEDLVPATLKHELEQTLYNMATHSARERFKRIAAMQVAMPGDPTFNILDLLGQTGGEGDKNMYLGNRPPVRFDWVYKDVAGGKAYNPVLAQDYHDLTGLTQLRKHSVLNEGNLELPLDPDRNPDEKGLLENSPVIPFIRSTATEKMLCLINRGYQDSDKIWKTFPVNGSAGNRYPEFLMDDKTAKDYQLDFSFSGYPAKRTVFQSVDQEGKNEYYGIAEMPDPDNAKQKKNKLVLLKSKPDGTLYYPPLADRVGIDVTVARFLKFIPVHGEGNNLTLENGTKLVTG